MDKGVQVCVYGVTRAVVAFRVGDFEGSGFGASGLDEGLGLGILGGYVAFSASCLHLESSCIEP